MEYEIYKSDDELTHWGVTGMKWGVRRYQNKDGSLTVAGKKRYNAELAKVREQEKIMKNREAVKGRMDRLKARQDAVADRKKALDEAEGKGKLFGKSKKKTENPDETAAVKKANKKKSVKDMTDEELANQIRRVQMEKQYESLTAQPETVKKGNNFMKDFMDKSVVPAVQQAGQQLIRDKLLDIGKKKLGLSGEQMDAGLKYMKEKSDEMAIVNKYHTQKKLYEQNQAAEAAEAAEKAAKKEAKAAEKAAKKEAQSSTNSVVTKDTVSSGQSYVSNIVNSPVTTSSANASSGQSFVARYDRAAIAGMDDD